MTKPERLLSPSVLGPLPATSWAVTLDCGGGSASARCLFVKHMKKVPDTEPDALVTDCAVCNRHAIEKRKKMSKGMYKINFLLEDNCTHMNDNEVATVATSNSCHLNAKT